MSNLSHRNLTRPSHVVWWFEQSPGAGGGRSSSGQSLGGGPGESVQRTISERRAREGEIESSDFRWRVSILHDFAYDSSLEVLDFTVSTFHFMVCFEHSTKKVSIL